MKRILGWFIVGATASVFAATAAFAQSGHGAPANRVNVPVASIAGSAQAGQQLATNGGANGVTACASCHGAQGEGNAAANFPRIAGQSAYYLTKQMEAFANGARENPIMSPISRAMTPQQRRDTSAWFESLQTPAASAPAAAAPASGNANAAGSATGAAGGTGATNGSTATSAARGRQLANIGDESKQVQACANCHGPGGRGEAPSRDLRSATPVAVRGRRVRRGEPCRRRAPPLASGLE